MRNEPSSTLTGRLRGESETTMNADDRTQKSGLQESRKQEGPVRMAVVGQGYFAQSAILPAFDEVPECELVALFSGDDTKLEQLKAAYDVPYALGYDQYDQFLRSGAVDAVYIALPNDLHCDFAVRAAAAGIHVLCEKPMAVTSQQCERMIDACEQANVKLMIAYRLHFDEGNLAVVDLIKDGKLGVPRFMTAVFSQQVSEHNSRTQAHHGEDPLYDMGVYCINACRYVFRAEPIEVVAQAASRRSDPRFSQIDEQLSATLLFPEDRLATFVCSFGAAKCGWYQVVGTEGSLRVDPAFTSAEPLRYELTVNGKTKSKKFRKRDQVAGELTYFANCILNDTVPEPAGEEGLADLRIIEAIRQAVHTGARMPVRAVERASRPSTRQVEKQPAHRAGPLVHVQTPSRH